MNITNISLPDEGKIIYQRTIPGRTGYKDIPEGEKVSPEEIAQVIFRSDDNNEVVITLKGY